MTYLSDEHYLGDGVYVGHDDFYVWLWTERDGHVHKIALDPAVLIALNIYLTDVVGKET